MEGVIWTIAAGLGAGIGIFATKFPELFLEIMPRHMRTALFVAVFMAGGAVGFTLAHVNLLRQWPQNHPAPSYAMVDGPMWIVVHIAVAGAGLVIWTMILAPIAGEIAKRSLKR